MYWDASVWLQLHGCLVNHSVPTLPRAQWQRLFLAVWLFCCLVITAAYTCNLVSIITSPAYPRRINTLEELEDSSFRYRSITIIISKRR